VIGKGERAKWENRMYDVQNVVKPLTKLS